MTDRPLRTTSRRDAGMANLASIGIVLVVTGHSAPSLDSAGTPASAEWMRAVLGVISLFHMPLFFFVSGYLTSLGWASDGWARLDYRAFVQRKAQRLLLPYWAISTAAFPLKVWMGEHALRPVEFSWKGYFVTLFVPWQNTIVYFWFLPTLFLIFLVAPLLMWTLRSPRLSVRAAAALGLILLAVSIQPVFWTDPLNYRGAAVHAATFWFGMAWREYEVRGPAGSDRTQGWAVVAAVIFVGLVLGTTWVTWVGAWPQGLALVRLVQAWSGVVATYGLVRWMTSRGLERVPWIDGQVFTIYLLSWFPQMFVKIVLYQKLAIGYWPAAVLMLTGGLLGPLAVAGLVRKRWPALRPILGMAS